MFPGIPTQHSRDLSDSRVEAREGPSGATTDSGGPVRELALRNKCRILSSLGIQECSNAMALIGYARVLGHLSGSASSSPELRVSCVAGVRQRTTDRLDRRHD